MLNISEFMVVRLIFLRTLMLSTLAGHTLVIQLNTKTASRNYRLLLGWEPAQAF